MGSGSSAARERQYEIGEIEASTQMELMAPLSHLFSQHASSVLQSMTRAEREKTAESLQAVKDEKTDCCDIQPQQDESFEDLIWTGGPCKISGTEYRGTQLHQLIAITRFIRSRSDSSGSISGWFDDDPNNKFRSSKPMNVNWINLYQLNYKLILPATTKWQCSYVEAVSTQADEQHPEWFVSHWWGEPVAHFVICIQEFARLRGTKRPVFWVCAYANNQHQLATAVTTDPADSSFRKAMKLSVGTVVILDSNSTPFTRIWCAYEVATTLYEKSKLLDIVTFVHCPHSRDVHDNVRLFACPTCSFVSRGPPTSDRCSVYGCHQCDIFQCEACHLKIRGTSPQSAEICMPGKVEMMTGGFVPSDHAADRLMVWQPRLALGGVKNPPKSGSCLDATPGIRKSLREATFPWAVGEKALEVKVEHAEASVPSDRVHILNAIANKQNLDEHPQYTCVNQMLSARFAIALLPQAGEDGDEARFNSLVEMIAKNIHLTNLNLSMPHWQKLTNRMLSGLARNLLQSLRELTLDVEKIHQIDQTFFMNFAERLKVLTNLEQLDLNSDSCDMGDVGVVALSNSLKTFKNMTRLVFNGFCSYKYAARTTDEGLTKLSEALKPMINLEHLDLNFGFCKEIGDKGFLAFAESLQSTTSLRHLQLNFRGKPPSSLRIGDSSFIAFCECLASLPSLTHLDLDCQHCHRITDSGINALSKNLAGRTSLIHIKMCLEGLSTSSEMRHALQRALKAAHPHAEVIISW